MQPCFKEEATDIDLRPYRDERDLDKMRAILVEGRRASGPTYYVHVGDLNWWVFYLDQEDDLCQRAYLWERRHDGIVVGWALASPRFSAFDVFVHPEIWDTGRAEPMFAWAEEWAGDLVWKRGGTSLQTVWTSERDARLIAHLQSRGFARSDDYMICMQRQPDRDLPRPALPHGFCVRPVVGEREALQRAAASHAAFGSSQPLGRYQRRYLAFVRSPAYTPELDLVCVAPDGRIAAFCICWLDSVNRVGHLEPVGTHPDFQRRKLGTAVLQAGLRCMAERGMTAASVCVESSNVAGQALYRSAGFRPLFKLHTFTKALQRESGMARKGGERDTMTDLEVLLGVCGLYCGACYHYCASLPEGGHLLAEAARRGRSLEGFACQGCRSPARYIHPGCARCEIRACAQGRDAVHCGLCPEFPCPRLLAFQGDGRLHHRDVLAHLEALTAQGIHVWLAQQAQRWTCRCGASFSWYEDICHHCGAPLDSYGPDPAVTTP